jgi:hypothetical protein
MAQRGDVHKTTRFRGPTEVTLRGAGSSGNEAQQIGAGGDTAFRIALPAQQTAAAFTIEKPEGTVIYSIGADGNVTVTPTLITASGAIPIVAGSYVITNAAVTALTLAAPATPAQDGLTISVSSTTAFAHTITTAGLLQTGTPAVNAVDFQPFAGANVTLRAHGGFWQVVAQNQVTFA